MVKIRIPGIKKFSLVDVLLISAAIYAAYRWLTKEENKYNPSSPKAVGPELPGIGYVPTRGFNRI
jgi:hypothetical protein